LPRNKKKEWFESWFNEHYQLLYPHRNQKEAELQVQLALAEMQPLPLSSRQRVLDLACGEGRHLGAFNKLLGNLDNNSPCVSGMDLSATLLSTAKSSLLPLVRGDMRHLPYKNHSFALVCCFFSSFGYFETKKADEKYLFDMSRLIQPGGILFLDLANRAPLVNNLIPLDNKTIKGVSVTQERRIEGDRVIKHITIHRPGQPLQKYQENLRLYSHAQIVSWAQKYKLTWVKTVGDERGATYVEDSSPRMSMVFKKAST